MKKKLIQILMLLVGAVSVGSFVSCKDTNEDLYNELRTQVIDQNASLQDALNQQQAALEDLLQKYKDLLATVNAINSCDCDKTKLVDMQGEITDLQNDVQDLQTALSGIDTSGTDLSAINAAILALQTELGTLTGNFNNHLADYAGLSASFTSEIGSIRSLITLLQTALGDKVEQATLTAIINDLQNQIDGIRTGLQALQDPNLLDLINTNRALQDGLETRIVALETALASVKNCVCEDHHALERLSKAEQAIIENKLWIEQQLADINGDVAAAQTAADNAYNLAHTANLNAQRAFDEAQRIEGLANAAQAAANSAQGDATQALLNAQAAQNAADLAYAHAAQAMSTANAANNLANTVNTLVAGLTGRVDAAENNIAQLQQDTRNLLKLINEKEETLQAAIDKVKGDLGDKIDALDGRIDNLKDDIQGKIDALKSELQGKIDNLDGKFENKIYDLLGKISELKATVSNNTDAIKKNAEDIAKNAENIKANADAIAKVKDDLNKFDLRLSLATETANNAYNEAVKAKAKADANEEAINKLKVAVGVNEANIKNLNTTTEDLKKAVKDLQDKAAQIGVNTKAIEDLSDTVDDLKGNIKDLYDKYENLQNQLKDLSVELQKVSDKCDANFNAAKAYVDTQIATLKSGVLTMIADALNNYYDKDAINAMLKDFVTKDALNGTASQEDLNKLYDKIIQLYKDMAAGDQAIGQNLYELAQKVAANEQHLIDIDKVLQAMDAKFKDYVPREALIAWYMLLKDRIDSVNGRIDGLKNDLKDELKDELVNFINVDLIDDIKDQLPDIIKTVINEQTTLVTKDNLETLVNDLINGKFVDAQDFADAVADLTALEARVGALETGTVKIADYDVDKQALWDAINTNFSTLDNKIGDVQKAVNTINGQLQTMKSDINTLKDDMKDAKSRLDGIDTEISTIKGDVKKLQDYLGSLVTGITIQGTHNTMFGSFNIPGVEPYIVSAYYGNPKDCGKIGKTKFPVCESDNQAENYVRDTEVLTDADWAMISLTGVKNQIEQNAGVTLMNLQEGAGADAEAYAGKIYMTINPTSANFKNLQLSIVNTKDETSPFILKNVGPSKATLEWGYTRATETNGFYAADVYIKRDAMDGVERPFDEAAIKDLAVVAKDQFKAIADGMMSAGHTGLDKLATSVYDVIRTLRLEKNGLKCEYTDANGKQQAVYSQYNLAATALKPLGLEFGKDFNFVTVPGYERVEKLLASVDRQLKNKVHTAFQSLNNSQLIEMILNFNIKSIALKDLDPDLVAKFEITVGDDVKIDGLTYHMVLGENSSVPVRFAYPLTVDGTTITSIPSNILIDPANPGVMVPTLVVSGDVTTGNPVPCQLVIPVKNDAIVNYVWYDMAEVTNFTTNLTAGGKIVIDGKNVANVSGSTLTSTGSNINLSQTIDLSSSTTPVLHLEFTYDLRNEIQDIWGQTQDVVSDVNKMMNDLKKIIDEANNTLAKINNYEKTIDDAIDSVLGGKGVGKLHKYLDKINNIIVNAVNGITYQIAPFMVTEDVNGFKLISATKSYPTVMTKTDLKIYATSKTLEILVPYARKHVAVTNVFKGTKSAQGGDADCQAKLKAVNSKGDMNTVIDGTQRMIETGGFVSGYTYEIAYSALDFRGNISTRRGYILIK